MSPPLLAPLSRSRIMALRARTTEGRRFCEILFSVSFTSPKDIAAPVITRGNHYLVITGNYLVITNPFLRLPVMEQAGSSPRQRCALGRLLSRLLSGTAGARGAARDSAACERAPLACSLLCACWPHEQASGACTGALLEAPEHLRLTEIENRMLSHPSPEPFADARSRRA